MEDFEITKGEGRTRVCLSAHYMGNYPIICVYNENAHIGAVALGEYDGKEKRSSTSVMTRLGHKDDAVAQKVAHSISRSTQKAVCVIAGIHVDDVTEVEINRILENVSSLIDEFLSREVQNIKPTCA
jgi:hypothetical protein